MKIIIQICNLKNGIIKSILIVFFLLQFYQIYAQGNNNNSYIPRILPLSPDANALGKYGNVNLDLNTGTINQNIPLFSLPINQNSIEIGLNYISNGIKIDEYESSVGVGWTLNMGGVINRSLFDKEDEKYVRLPAINRNASAEEFRNYLVDAESKDTQPDIFSFNVNGLSGKFFLDDNGKAVLINQEDIKIQLIQHGNTEFKITDQQGTKYYFGGSNFTENNTSLTKCTQTGGTSYIDENLMINNIDASWYLNKIEYNNGSYILFKYKEPKPITYISGVNEKMKLTQTLIRNTEGIVSYPIYNNCINNIISKTKLLEEVITSSGYKITLEYESKYQDESAFLRVKNIKLKNSLDKEIKSINLTYKIINSENINLKINGDLYTKHSYLKKRIYLSEIQEYGQNSKIRTTFLEYITPEKLPARLSYSQDNFGYYNGAYNNNFISFKNLDIPFGAPKLISADKIPKANYAKYGLLSKIIYPTGGHTAIEYEGNTVTGEYYKDKKKTAVAYFYSDDKNSTQFIEIHSGRKQRVEYSLSKYFDYNNSTKDICRMYADINFYPGIIGGSIYMKIFNKKTNRYINFKDNLGNISDKKEVSHREHTFSCYYEKKVIADEIISGNYICEKLFFTYPGGNSHLEIEPILKKDEYDAKFYGLELDHNTDYRIEITKSAPCHNGEFSISYYDSIMGELIETQEPASGLRVKQITDADVDNKTIKLTTYHYGKENCLDNCSSGKLNNGIDTNTQTYFINIKSDGSSTKTFLYNNNSLTSLYSLSRPPVSYMKVFKETINVNNQTSQFTEYFFDIKQDRMPEPRYNYFFMIPNTPMSNVFGNGKLIKEIEYSKEMKPVKVKEYTYLTKKENTYTSLSSLKFRSSSSFTNDDYIPSNYTSMEYNINSAFYYLDNVKEYLITESLPISTNTFYYYNSPNHLQLTSQTTSTSTGGELITNYQYPPDINGNPLMQALTSQNRISTPVTTEVLRKQDGSEKQISFTETRYAQDASTANLILPKYIYTKKGEAVLEKKITYDSYDNKGNLLQYTLESGIPVSIIWGYNQQHPIAKIEGTSYSEIESYVINLQNLSNNSDEQGLLSAYTSLRNKLPLAMITTYTYLPLIGVSTITPPNGLTEYYTYDDAGRLKEIKNQDGQLLKSFEYHYKSQN